MTTYKRVLFAADFVEEDDNPVSRKAVELVKNDDAELSIIHVIEIPATYGEAYEASAIVQWQEEVKVEAAERLDRMGKKLGVPKERQFLRLGGTRIGILDVAKTIDADLIVLGSHARHGLGLLFLGSTANGILNGAECDVLAVRV